MTDTNLFYNMDCIEGCREHIANESVDLIVTDPPYGIEGDTLHKHYNRKEEFVIDGYVEVPQSEYAPFSKAWLREAERILRPGGSIYVVSGYTNLPDILNAFNNNTDLIAVNHIIWKYNFGVYTSRKYVSSHYHILYYVKQGAPPTFNLNCRYGPNEKVSEEGGSLNYVDREDVWLINREYKPGKAKNKNELPTQLLIKMMQYSSNEGDMVCDLFLGSFSTAKIAIGLNRKACGFEVSKQAFKHQMREMKKIEPGEILLSLRQPDTTEHKNQRTPWSKADVKAVLRKFRAMRKKQIAKKDCIAALAEEFGRGPWGILRVVENKVKGR